MGAKYYATCLATNTGSTTVPMWALTGGTAKRVRFYHTIIGSAIAPANQAGDFAVRRTTSAGTTSSAFVATKLDLADGVSIAVFDITWAANPTITASSDCLNIAMNQQATVQWMVDPSNGIVIPATSGAGLVMMSVSTTSAGAFRHAIFYEE